MDELTSRAAGFYIYMADAISFFDQVPVDERDRDMTAIRTPLGLMQMTGKPASFEESEEHPGVREFVVEHMLAVERMLQKLLDSGLTIHGSKNEFFVPQVLTLGVVLSQKGRSVNPSKVDAILKWERCRNVSELRSFLGMATVWRMWIEHFSLVAEPLFRMYRVGQPFIWDSEQKSAFKEIKQALCSAPIRRNLDTSDLEARPPILSFDAFLVGEGACLGQVDENGNRVAQDRLVIGEEWTLTIICHHTSNPSIISHHTAIYNASALKGMVNNPAITDATMLQWILYISTFPVVWRLIKGKLHQVPDGLSRIFSKPPEEADAANDSGDVEDAIEAMLGLVAACQKEEIVESE
ncbi:hypothetical protein CcCBS67573_g10680, partial [Chytriomyces confervae]